MIHLTRARGSTIGPKVKWGIACGMDREKVKYGTKEAKLKAKVSKLEGKMEKIDDKISRVKDDNKLEADHLKNKKKAKDLEAIKDGTLL